MQPCNCNHRPAHNHVIAAIAKSNTLASNPHACQHLTHGAGLEDARRLLGGTRRPIRLTTRRCIHGAAGTAGTLRWEVLLEREVDEVVPAHGCSQILHAGIIETNLHQTRKCLTHIAPHIWTETSCMQRCAYIIQIGVLGRVRRVLGGRSNGSAHLGLQLLHDGLHGRAPGAMPRSGTRRCDGAPAGEGDGAPSGAGGGAPSGAADHDAAAAE